MELSRTEKMGRSLWPGGVSGWRIFLACFGGLALVFGVGAMVLSGVVAVRFLRCGSNALAFFWGIVVTILILLPAVFAAMTFYGVSRVTVGSARRSETLVILGSGLLGVMLTCYFLTDLLLIRSAPHIVITKFVR